MTGHIRPPAGSYIDDPAANLDRTHNDDAFAIALTKLEVIRFYEWINRGDARQRGLRSDLVSLCICPQLLPCKYPSAAWCAREHDVTREYASRLQREFVRQFGDYILLRGQRFHIQRPNRGRQKAQSPHSGAVARALPFHPATVPPGARCTNPFSLLRNVALISSPSSGPQFLRKIIVKTRRRFFVFIPPIIPIRNAAKSAWAANLDPERHLAANSLPSMTQEVGSDKARGFLLEKSGRRCNLRFSNIEAFNTLVKSANAAFILLVESREYPSTHILAKTSSV